MKNKCESNYQKVKFTFNENNNELVHKIIKMSQNSQKIIIIITLLLFLIIANIKFSKNIKLINIESNINTNITFNITYNISSNETSANSFNLTSSNVESDSNITVISNVTRKKQKGNESKTTNSDKKRKKEKKNVSKNNNSNKKKRKEKRNVRKVNNSNKKRKKVKKGKESISKTHKSNKKRIGVVGLSNTKNIGNNLVKYGMYMKLKEFGLEPIIISKPKPHFNCTSYFLEKFARLKTINISFNELKEKDYDIMMVNSDQTWSYSEPRNLFNYGLLEFAKHWKIPKFIYGASLGKEIWIEERNKREKAKLLLKNFTGISFREKETVRLVEKYLEIKSKLVIDPSFLIDKHYYLDLIKDYKREFNFNEKYLFVYLLDLDENITNMINEVKNKYDFKIYDVSLNNLDDKYYVEYFIFGINISQAVITDSYHGSLFSMMFDKPFISYINVARGKHRFENLKECFHLDDRIIEKGQYLNSSLLFEPLNINKTYLNELRNSSINYLKKNVGVK